MKIELPTIGLSGRYRMVVSSDAEMKDVKQELEFDNLITDVGLNRVGSINVSITSGKRTFDALCGGFAVGSGSTPPEFTDTSLVNQIAYTESTGLESESSSYANGFYELVVRTQFGQGVAAGNLSEIGIRKGANGPLWSRALILDGAGNPTSITVLSTDFLTCYYSLRIQIPQTDSVFNINVDIDGVMVPTTVTCRPLNTNSIENSFGWHLHTYLGNGFSSQIRSYPGMALLAPTAPAPYPTGSGLTMTSHSTDGFKKYVSGTAGLNSLNSNNMTLFGVFCLMGSWQVHFDPPLQKNNTQTMELTFGYSWARA